ncbi:tandem-95 repeat protein [uncultured Deefgea sp.]|uniref:tandem-95 repeat protein n=2 Tax=uncultured Deefgea sp. TaxID=1304914 RepID=UPI0025967B5F|nr:tandem-95 repeat protein [uncultured Deefgea sp.]
MPQATYVTNTGSSSTLDVKVTPVDDASVLQADSQTVLEDSPATGNVLTNDSDVDSALTVATFSVGGSNYTAGQTATIANVGTLTISSNGEYTFTPAPNWNGAMPQATYVTNTGSSSTLDVKVTPVNDAPTLDLDASMEDTSFITTYTENGSGVPIADIDSLINDVDNANLQSAKIVLTNAQLGDVLTTVGLPNGIVAAQSVVNGQIVLTLTGNASKADYETAIESIRFSSTSENPSTVDRILNVTVNDGLANSNTAISTVHVVAVNDAPETNATTATGDEDTLIAVNLSGSDVDGSVANFKVTALPANGTFYSDAAGTIAITAASVITATNNGATIYFKPNANWNGDTTFQYAATDNSGLADSTPANGKITVKAVNDAPDAIDDPATTTGLKSEYFVYHEGSNLDGSNLTSLAMVKAFIDSHSAAAVFTAKTFNYNLGNGDLGGNNNLQTFLGSDAASLNTDPENSSDAIIRMTGNITLAAGTYNFKVLADDGYVIYVDGKKVAEVDKIQSPTGTEHASFTIATGGNHTIEIVYWDQGGQAVFKPELRQGADAYQSLGNFILTSPVPYSTVEDTRLTITSAALLANDKDPDGDVLTITSVQGATNGSVALVNGNVVFTPAPNYTGPASFTYTISDGKGGVDTATVSLHVTAVNDAPDTAMITASGAEDTLITVNLSGSDVDGSVRSFNLTTLPSNGTFYSDAAGTVAITAATVIAATANGATIYFKPNANWNGIQTFEYAAKDVYGLVDTTPATGTITVNPVNDAPTFVSSTPVTVSEEGLKGGIADTTGTSDTSNATTAIGTVIFNDVDNTALTYTLTAPTGLTSGGQAINWSGNGTGALVGTVGNQTIATISIDGTGKYTVTLSGPVDHVDKTAEDVKSFNVTVSASDGKLSSSGQVTINIEDDAPVGQSTTATVQMPYINTNLILTLDTSGSMADASGIAGKTRLQVAKEALTQLINDYDNVGDVKIMLVGFSSTATTQLANGNTWLTAAEAKAILANFTADGGTNYDAGVAQVMTHFDDAGKLVGGQNVGYFFSDGVPGTGLGLDSTETKTWTDFLNSKDINSLAIGLGTGVAGTNLDPLAYNGTGSGTEANSIIVTDLAQLPPILRDTILTPTAGNITGGLVGSAVAGFGADGGHINDITVNGVKYTFNTAGNSITTTANGSTYTFDPVSHTLKVTTTLGGQFIIDLDDGKYTYTPPVTLQSNASENIGFTLIDNDGDLDKSNSTLTINVIPPRYNTAPVLVDDFSFTKANQAISLDVLANDKDLQGDKLTLTGTPTLTSGQGVVTIDPKTGLPVFTPDANFIGEATIRYTVSDGFGGTSSAIWTVKVVPNSNVLSGGAGVDLFTVVNGSADSSGLTVEMKSAGDWDYSTNPPTLIPGVNTSVTTASHDQVFVMDYRNDHVEAGAGNDLIYMGGTENNVTQTSNTLMALEIMNIATTGIEGTDLRTLSNLSSPTQSISDYANAGSGDDVVFGEQGSDVLYGGSGNDKLFGGSENDALRGGLGNDLLVGGSGSDILRGDAGSDTFKWTLGDQGTVGAPARDVVMDFNNAKSGNAVGDVDKLDLRDLLQGENSGSLTQYLHFEKSGTDTIVHVSSKGEFSNGNWTTKEDQVITLQGVDLTTSGNDQAIINELLSKGKLITD